MNDRFRDIGSVEGRTLAQDLNIVPERSAFLLNDISAKIYDAWEKDHSSAGSKFMQVCDMDNLLTTEKVYVAVALSQLFYRADIRSCLRSGNFERFKMLVMAEVWP